MFTGGTVAAYPAPRRVTVAICTYRRPSVSATLASVAAQLLPTGVVVDVVVADNDTEPSAKPTVEAAAAELALTCRYVHAPARNISVARNACMDHAAGDLLAFIDDDEVASPGWLAALLARMEVTGADAVLGPAEASYPSGAPPWVATADLHSTRPPITDTGAIRTGYTCNVLLRSDAFAGRRFDVALGRSGGEDDVFFADAVRGGAVIAYAPDAIVADPVPMERARLGWLCRRAFRNGQTHARNVLAGGRNRGRALATAAAKAGACLLGAGATIWSPVRWRRLLVRGMLHLGACARYLGWRELQLY